MSNVQKLEFFTSIFVKFYIIVVCKVKLFYISILVLLHLSYLIEKNQLFKRIY